MSKDAYWFKHDSTSGRGLRMRKMAHVYGHWGKGIYWDVIEILRDQSNYCFDSDEVSLQMLADLIGCKDEPKFLSWFNDCVKFELFKIQKNKFYCEVLCVNMEVWETKKGNGGKPKTKRIKSEIEAKQKHKITEDNRIEEKRFYFNCVGKKVELKEGYFYNEKIQMEYNFEKGFDGPMYRNGMSKKAIIESCNNRGIEYHEGDENV